MLQGGVTQGGMRREVFDRGVAACVSLARRTMSVPADGVGFGKAKVCATQTKDEASEQERTY